MSYYGIMTLVKFDTEGFHVLDLLKMSDALHFITENWYCDCLQKPENTFLQDEDESENKAFTCKLVTSHQNVVYPEIITQTNCIYA